MVDDRNTSPSDSASQAVTDRRRWWLPRFGLSTVLLAMGVVSVGAAWWSRVAPRFPNSNDGVITYSRTVEPEEGGEPKLDGDYHLVDSHGRIMVRGSHLAGTANGAWTTYYKSGYRASTGQVKAGVAVGQWTYWSRNGGRRAVIRYEPGPVTLVSEAAIVNQKRRHGPAQYWHPTTGHRASAGEYADNEREGEWSFWDEQGELIAKGEYSRGKRLGIWSVRRDGQMREVYYIDDTELAEVAQVTDRLEQLATRVRDGALTWEADLAELEAHRRSALPQLLHALETDHAAVQAAVLRSLMKLKKHAAPARTRVLALQRSSSAPVRLMATGCLLTMGESDQEALLRVMMQNATRPLQDTALPQSTLAETLDIAVVERLIAIRTSASPEVEQRLRRFVATLVFSLEGQNGAQYAAPNSRVAALQAKIYEEPLLLNGRQTRLAPYFRPAPAPGP